MRRRPGAEEVFVLHGVAALALAAALLWWRRSLLLEFFYFPPLLALTHLVTLGFLTSLMMGVLHRLCPMLLGVTPRSRGWTRLQLVLFLVGAWGMIAHFWMGEHKGMSWSAILLWGAALVQLANFRDLFRSSPKAPWARRFVAASLLHFALAASLGVLLVLLKGYDLRAPGLSSQHLDNVFAHAHLAGAGWVVSMIFGFQLELVPTTARAPSFLPLRFAMFQAGVLLLSASLLLEIEVAPAVLLLGLACGWQAYGPLRAFVTGRAREWEALALLLLVITAVLGVLLALGHPPPDDPARGRAQLAYAFLGIFGFMTLTVVTVAFKLFPIWVWKERFREDFGKRPVPGMKDLASGALKVFANLAVFAGSVGTAASIWIASPAGLTASMSLLVAGIGAFVANLVRVLRWSFLVTSFHPTEEDERKFSEMF